jgi:hypothetical protein
MRQSASLSSSNQTIASRRLKALLPNMSRTQAALSPPASLLATSAIQMGCGPTPAILA